LSRSDSIFPKNFLVLRIIKMKWIIHGNQAASQWLKEISCNQSSKLKIFLTRIKNYIKWKLIMECSVSKKSLLQFFNLTLLIAYFLFPLHGLKLAMLIRLMIFHTTDVLPTMVCLTSVCLLCQFALCRFAYYVSSPTMSVRLIRIGLLLT